MDSFEGINKELGWHNVDKEFNEFTLGQRNKQFPATQGLLIK